MWKVERPVVNVNKKNCKFNYCKHTVRLLCECWLNKALNHELRSQSSGGNDSCSKRGGGCNNICGSKNNSSSTPSICIIIEAVMIKVTEAAGAELYKGYS